MLEVTDLHVWGLNLTRHVLTAHVVVKPGFKGGELINRMINIKYKIFHTTIQTEERKNEESNLVFIH